MATYELVKKAALDRISEVVASDVAGSVDGSGFPAVAWTVGTAGSGAVTTQHGRDLPDLSGQVDGVVTLGPGESLWSKQVLTADPSKLIPIRAVVEAVGALPPANGVQFVVRRFDQFGGAATTLTPNVAAGIKTADAPTDLGTVLVGSEMTAKFYRVGIKNNLADGNIKVHGFTALVRNGLDGFFIEDFGVDPAEGADNADAFERAFAKIPAGLPSFPNILSLSGKEWSVSRTVSTIRNNTGLADGSLRALGVLEDWVVPYTEPNVYLDELHAFLGWVRPGFRLSALLKLRGYRASSRNINLVCNEVCNGIDDLNGHSYRVSKTDVSGFVHYACTYLGNSGSRLDDVLFRKFPSWTDPRIGSNSRSTGVGLLSAQADGAFINLAVTGCIGVYQAAGGTVDFQGGHIWNDSTGLEQRIEGPRAIGDQVPITVFMSDRAIDMSYNTNMLDVTIGADGFAVMTFKTALAAGSSTLVRCSPTGRYNAILKGWNSNWYGHYIDNAMFQLWGTAHYFNHCSGLFMNGQRLNGTHLFELVPTSVKQDIGRMKLEANISGPPNWAAIVPNPNNPAYSFDVDAKFLSVKDLEFVGAGGGVMLSSAAVVQTLASTSADHRAMIGFSSDTTVTVPTVGAEGDTLVMRTGGTTRVQVDADGATRFFKNMRFASNTVPSIDDSGRVGLPIVYTIATLPSPSSIPRRLLYVSDAPAGKGKVVYSTATRWEYMDGTPVA